MVGRLNTQCYEIASTISEDVEIATERICGSPHIRSYVSSVIMWRQVSGTRKSAAMVLFAAT
jgi:hypothetical protein